MNLGWWHRFVRRHLVAPDPTGPTYEQLYAIYGAGPQTEAERQRAAHRPECQCRACWDAAQVDALLAEAGLTRMVEEQ